MLLDVYSKKNVPIETFNISFESTQNKQQYGTKITYLWEREEKIMAITNLLIFMVLTYSPPKCRFDCSKNTSNMP